MLTVLFILLATVAMIGPTQAVSGVVTASVAVTETFAQLLGGVDHAKPTAMSAPQTSFQEWFDAALNDFSQMIGTLAPQGESELSASVDAMPAVTTAGDQSSTQDSSGFAGGGGSGNRAARSTPGSGTSGVGGGGGSSSGSFADTPAGRQLAASDLALESAAASLTAGNLDDAIIEGFGGAPFDSLDPVALGPGPGSNPGDPSSIPGVELVPAHNPFSPSSPVPSLAGDPTPSIPGGTRPSVNGGPTEGGPPAPPVNNVPSRAVIEDLLDDQGIPATAAAELDSLRNASAGRQSGTGVFQVPEPSVLLLGAVGTAAIARRHRRRTGHRQ
jgi:hypothetical protein